jgi:hypothetical protein
MGRVKDKRISKSNRKILSNLQKSQFTNKIGIA